MKHQIKITDGGELQWLGDPPAKLDIVPVRKTRFSEIVPSNIWLLVAFRIIRFLFGEGKWFIPEWTRQWKCGWKAEILIGKHKGETEHSENRQALIDWEHEMFFDPKIKL